MFNIDKLSENNYDSWSLQMKSVLIHQDLWDVVSQLPTTENKTDIEWKKRDDKATATIILSITPVQLSYIKNSKTAADAWNTLRDIHQPKGPVRKVTLFKQLLGMRMREDDCIQQYVCNFTSVVDKLAEAGIDLSEDLLVIMILASLPKSFENLVVALESRDDLPKLSVLKVKLSEEGERRKTSEPTNNDGTVQVFMSHNNKTPRNTQVNRNNTKTTTTRAITEIPQTRTRTMSNATTAAAEG